MTTAKEDPFGQIVFKKNVWRLGADEKRDFNYIHFNAFEQNVVVHHMGQLKWQLFVERILCDDACCINIFDFSYVVTDCNKF